MLITIEKVVYPGRRLAVRDGTNDLSRMKDFRANGSRSKPFTTQESYLEARTDAHPHRVARPRPAALRPLSACSAYQSMAPDAAIAPQNRAAWRYSGRAREPGMGHPGLRRRRPDPWHYRNKVRFRLAWSGRPCLARLSFGRAPNPILFRSGNAISSLLRPRRCYAARPGRCGPARTPDSLKASKPKESRATRNFF